MNQAIDTLKLNIQSVKHIDIVYQYLSNNNIKTIDLSELLRAEIVLAVSALDNFISDILLFGLVETFEGKRNIDAELSRSFNEFQIDMLTLIQTNSATSKEDKSIILANYIRKVNSKKPYQDPKQIESALLLLGIKQIWTKLGIELSMKGEDISRELANIAWQRNKIAHEADINFMTQMKRVRDSLTTLQAIEFIEKLCVAIYKIVCDQKERQPLTAHLQ